MPALSRAASARLRAQQRQRKQRIKTTFFELHCANDALLTAAAGLTCALREGMADHDDAYELLRALHYRIKQTIDDAQKAADAEGVSA